MANSYTPVTNVLDFQKAFKPAGAFPLDARSMFATKNAAEIAAASAVLAGSADQAKSSYYIGQMLTVFENDVVTHYSIEPDKTLKEVGKSIATDDKTIVMNNEVLSLKDWGVQYYAYNADAAEGEESHTLTVGWKAGLQPRVIANTDGSGYSLAWFEPSSTTVEGLNDIVTSMQGTVDGLDERIGSAEGNITANANAITAEAERAEAAEAALDTRVTKNTSDITLLNGDADTEGSVKYQIAQAVAQLMENPDDAINSINELVTWTQTHAGDALTLTNDVAANKQAIADLEALVGTLPEGTQAVDVIGYIAEAIAVETARARGEEAALLAKIEALETANTTLGSAAYESKESFATAAQGAKADTAIQTVVAGENGHITVDGNDVLVYSAPVAKTNEAGVVMVDGTSITASENGVISVVAVESSKVTGLDTIVANAKSGAVSEAADAAAELYVPKTDVVAVADLAADAESASDTKPISEKAFMSSMEWQTEM